MSLQFQQPAPLNLQKQNTIPQSIDALFNMYQQSRLGDSQLADAELQRQASRANFSLQNQGLQPEDVNRFLPQAMGPAPQQAPSLYAQPNDLQFQTGAGQGPVMAPQTGAPAQPAEDPRVGVLRNILALHMQGQQLGAQKEVAGIQSQQATTAKTLSEARLNDFFSGQGAGAAEWAANIRQDVASGKTAPSQAMAEASRVGPNGMGRFLVDKALSGLPLEDLENKYAANKAKATSVAEVQGGTTQKVGALAGTLEDVLNKAEPLMAKLNTSKFKALNEAFLTGKQQVNDPDVNEVLPLLNSAKGLYAAVIASGGSPQKEDKELASENIARGLNPAAFSGLKRAVLFETQSRIKRLGGKGYSEAAPDIQPPQAPVQVRTLKNGQQVRVRQLPNGKFAEVP